MTGVALLPDHPGLMPIVGRVISHGRNEPPAASHEVDGTADAVTGALAARSATRACLLAWLALMGDTAGQPASERAKELALA